MMSDAIEIVFPSGQKVRVPNSPKQLHKQQQARREHSPRRPPNNALEHPCEHIGKPVNPLQGCAAKHNEVWECSEFGKCAPLAVLQTYRVRACRYCEKYTPAADPSVFAMARTYATALGRWVKAGRPTRTPEQMRAIMTICRACPFLSRTATGATYCGKCGCAVHDEPGNPAANKIAMATESCPADPPRWGAEG